MQGNGSFKASPHFQLSAQPVSMLARPVAAYVRQPPTPPPAPGALRHKYSEAATEERTLPRHLLAGQQFRAAKNKRCTLRRAEGSINTAGIGGERERGVGAIKRGDVTKEIPGEEMRTLQELIWKAISIEELPSAGGNAPFFFILLYSIEGEASCSPWQPCLEFFPLVEEGWRAHLL